MSHFYTIANSGAVEPRHFVPNKSQPGKMRPSTLRDAKAALKNAGEIWVPSVTTVLNILDKPGLNEWRIDQHLQTVFDDFNVGNIPTIEYDNWVRGVKRVTQERLDEAPQLGTDIHKILEDFFRFGREPDDPIQKLICHNVKDVIDEKCGKQDWLEEVYMVNEVHGFGGQTDRECDVWTIDYKSKKEASKFKPGKMAYDEHRMQLAAYKETSGTSKAANIFICLENGEVDFHEHSAQEMERGWDMFLAALSFYKLQKNWDAAAA